MGRMPDPTPGARATTDPDLFGYRDLLADDERTLLKRLRDWLEAELAPIATDHWARAEFPHQLLPGFAGLQVIGLPYDLPDAEAESRLLAGFTSLEIARIDA